MSFVRYMEELCVLAEYISGNLCCPYKEIKTIKITAEKIDVARYFAWIYLKIGIISSALKDIISDDDEEDDDDEDDSDKITDSEKDKPVLILFVIDQAEVYVTQILHDICIGQTYLETYNNVSTLCVFLLIY